MFLFYSASLRGDVAELSRVVKLISSQTLAADSLPSVCFYSVMNSGVSVSAIETSDDSSLLAIGFTNSHIKVTQSVQLLLLA